MKKIDRALEQHLKKALPVAVDAAVAAGTLIRRKFGKFKNLQFKNDQSLVTEVDKGSEAIVLRKLRKKFPHDTLIAEETGASLGQSATPFRWHIDPLDGTSNFVHSFPIFCVSIGLEFELSEIVLGVIYQPITQDLYIARKGAGAFKNKKRIHVSSTSKISDAMLSTGFSFKRRELFGDEITSFGRVAYSTHAIRRTGSAAMDLTYVSTGQFDGFWERGLQTWDTCAGLALLGEAGGTYSRIDGKPFRLGDGSILASNSKLHRRLVDTLAG